MHVSLQVKHSLRLSVSVELDFSRRGFQKYSKIKFNENPSSGSRVVTCTRTDERTDMTQLTVTFRNFANAPKNCSDYAENVGRHRKKLSRPRPGARDLCIPDVLYNGINLAYVQINHSHPAVDEILRFYSHSLLRPTLGTRTQSTCSHPQYHRPRHLAVTPLHSVVPSILATTSKLYLHTPRKHARRTDLPPHSFVSSALHGGLVCVQFNGPAVSAKGIKPCAHLTG
jgi:hypothetical protein